MARSDGDGSDSDTGPPLPAGVLRSRGGWDDADNLEMEHQRERLRAAAAAAGADGDCDGAAKAAPIHAAVDLAQFRNEEVGRGYQAKHVVRQRGASYAGTGVVDMTGGKFSKGKDEVDTNTKSSEVRKRGRGDEEDDPKLIKKGDRKRPPAAQDGRLETYLKCKGMRDFMKDIDKILNE